MEPELEELVAYHEAGHAVMAVHLGGRIMHVSIEPPDDDGPLRSGESIVKWPAMTQEQLVLAELQVSLAGPIAEMVFSGQLDEIANVPEFAGDWQRAMQGLAMVRAEQRQRLLSRSIDHGWKFFETEQHWAAVCAVADLLSAHETIEHDEVAETLAFWTSRY